MYTIYLQLWSVVTIYLQLWSVVTIYLQLWSVVTIYLQLLSVVTIYLQLWSVVTIYLQLWSVVTNTLGYMAVMIISISVDEGIAMVLKGPCIRQHPLNPLCRRISLKHTHICFINNYNLKHYNALLWVRLCSLLYILLWLI